MPRGEISGEQYSLDEVFGERFAFFVPPFQRPYAWTTEHAGELLDDLLGSLGAGNEPVNDLSPYFLGSIVLIKGDRPEAQIVDGQQRLITLTILMAVLRSLIPEEFAGGITKRLYEPADPLNGVPARYRLRPKERDTEFFQNYIQSEGGIQRLRGQIHVNLPTSQFNMRADTLYYLGQISTLPEELRVRLAQFVVQRCLLVAVSASDLDAAYRIFSILNNRGLDLTTADILKAEIIARVPGHAQHEYTARWEQTEESLGIEGFNELLGHIGVIYRKGQVRNILDEFRTYVVDHFGDARRLIDDALVPLGEAYYTIREANFGRADANTNIRINALLRWLNQIDNSDWIPPAMLYLRRYHDVPERLVRFFGELERLAASLMIRRQYLNKRRQRYARLLTPIEGGEDLGLPRSAIHLSEEDGDATLGQLSAEFYLMAASPRNYVLRRLDSSLAGTEAVYDQPRMTVEHVLPRTLVAGGEWARWFPTAELHGRWIHRLGNLALLSRTKNHQASNYDFATKKKKYFATQHGISPFALTTQVLQEEVWTPKVIERRQQALIAHLKQLWRL